MRTMLPHLPMGDPSLPDSMLHALVRAHTGQVDLGDACIQADDGMLPAMDLRGVTETGAIAAHIAGMHPAAAHATLQDLHRVVGPQAAAEIKARATIQSMAKNHHVPFERVAGGRIISSTLGPPPVHLRPTEVIDLKRAIHESVPFQPVVFPFAVGGPGVFTFDIPTALAAVAGTNYPLFYAGFILTMQASVFNTQIGAFMNVSRNLGLTSVVQNVTDIVQLESGAKVVQMLLLNGIIVAGKPRFWAPPITGGALDPNTAVTLTNVPTNYTPTLRLLQPGDQQVEHLLGTL